MFYDDIDYIPSDDPLCILDYMSDEEIDDYYDSLEAELNEMSKFL